MKVTTLTCLFVSRDGQLAIQLLEPPVPDEYQMTTVPPGMMHAARLLGLRAEVRVFKRIAEGALPVYQET